MKLNKMNENDGILLTGIWLTQNPDIRNNLRAQLTRLNYDENFALMKVEDSLEEMCSSDTSDIRALEVEYLNSEKPQVDPHTVCMCNSPYPSFSVPCRWRFNFVSHLMAHNCQQYLNFKLVRPTIIPRLAKSLQMVAWPIKIVIGPLNGMDLTSYNIRNLPELGWEFSKVSQWVVGFNYSDNVMVHLRVVHQLLADNFLLFDHDQSRFTDISQFREEVLKKIIPILPAPSKYHIVHKCFDNDVGCVKQRYPLRCTCQNLPRIHEVATVFYPPISNHSFGTNPHADLRQLCYSVDPNEPTEDAESVAIYLKSGWFCACCRKSLHDCGDSSYTCRLLDTIRVDLVCEVFGLDYQQTVTEMFNEEMIDMYYDGTSIKEVDFSNVETEREVAMGFNVSYMTWINAFERHLDHKQAIYFFRFLVYHRAPLFVIPDNAIDSVVQLNGSHGEYTMADDLAWNPTPKKTTTPLNIIISEQMEFEKERKFWESHKTKPKGYKVERLGPGNPYMDILHFHHMYSGVCEGGFKTIINHNGACARAILAYLKSTNVPENVYLSHVLQALPRSWGLKVGNQLYSTFRKMRRFVEISNGHVSLIQYPTTLTRNYGDVEFVDQLVNGRAAIVIPEWEKLKVDHTTATRAYAKVEKQNSFNFSTVFDTKKNHPWLCQLYKDLKLPRIDFSSKGCFDVDINFPYVKYMNLLLYLAIVPDCSEVVVGGLCYSDLITKLRSDYGTTKFSYRMAPPRAMVTGIVSGQIGDGLKLIPANQSLITLGQQLGVQLNGNETLDYISTLGTLVNIDDGLTSYKKGNILYNSTSDIFMIATHDFSPVPDRKYIKYGYCSKLFPNIGQILCNSFKSVAPDELTDTDFDVLLVDSSFSNPKLGDTDTKIQAKEIILLHISKLACIKYITCNGEKKYCNLINPEFHADKIPELYLAQTKLELTEDVLHEVDAQSASSLTSSASTSSSSLTSGSSVTSSYSNSISTSSIISAMNPTPVTQQAYTAKYKDIIVPSKSGFHYLFVHRQGVKPYRLHPDVLGDNIYTTCEINKFEKLYTIEGNKTIVVYCESVIPPFNEAMRQWEISDCYRCSIFHDEDLLSKVNNFYYTYLINENTLDIVTSKAIYCAALEHFDMVNVGGKEYSKNGYALKVKGLLWNVKTRIQQYSHDRQKVDRAADKIFSAAAQASKTRAKKALTKLAEIDALLDPVTTGTGCDGWDDEFSYIHDEVKKLGAKGLSIVDVGDEVDYQPIATDTWYANRVIRSFKHYKRGPGMVEKLLWEARKYNVPDAILGTRYGLDHHCQEGSFFRVLEYGPTEQWHCDADIRPVAFRSAENREKTLTICSLAAEFTTDFVGNDYRDPKSQRKTVSDIRAIIFCQEMVESILSQKKLFLTDTSDYSVVVNAVDSTSMANFNCPVLSIVEGSKMVALMKIASQMNTQSSNYFAQPNLGQLKSSMDIPWMMLKRVASALT